MQADVHLQIRLHARAFDPLLELQTWQQHRCLQRPDLLACPAESQFIGRVRATASDGSPLEALELEHYPGMTERQLQALALACGGRHGVQTLLIAHRTGLVRPGETIVLVAVGADRRGPAQRCCQELLEALKHDAPFWKREWHADGRGHWLTGNTPF